MNTETKLIKSKLGLLELAKHLGNVSEACKIYDKMIEENVTICLTLSGALTPTGIGGLIVELIKNGWYE